MFFSHGLYLRKYAPFVTATTHSSAACFHSFPQSVHVISLLTELMAANFLHFMLGPAGQLVVYYCIIKSKKWWKASMFYSRVSFLYCSLINCCFLHWFTGCRSAIPSQWEAIYFRYENHLSVCHQAAESEPGRSSQPCGVCCHKGHQVHGSTALPDLPQ